MKIYFAAPLFNEAERKFNIELAKKLEAAGFKVFLPQRDGIESSEEYATKDEKRRAMFEKDKEGILNSDTLLFVLDGRVPDEGAAFELGFAYAQGNKTLVGLHTDSRAAFISSKLNPMLKVPLEYIANSEQELLDYLENRF